MAIFAILMPESQPRLVEAIKKAFPNDHLPLNDTQWLVSASGTVIDLSKKLGVADLNNLNQPATGNAVIFLMSSYFGRAPANVWDWLKVKLEARPSG